MELVVTQRKIRTPSEAKTIVSFYLRRTPTEKKKKIGTLEYDTDHAYNVLRQMDDDSDHPVYLKYKETLAEYVEEFSPDTIVSFRDKINPGEQRRRRDQYTVKSRRKRVEQQILNNNER